MISHIQMVLIIIQLSCDAAVNGSYLTHDTIDWFTNDTSADDSDDDDVTADRVVQNRLAFGKTLHITTSTVY